MHPYFGPIPAYGIFYFLGIALHFVIAWRLTKRWGLKRCVWIAISLCYFLGMTVGAKILFDLRYSDLDFAALLTAQHWTRGGLWGGPLAYFALAAPLALLLTKDRRRALDLTAVVLPIPWIAAKLGCLFNGCCHGKPCSLPWAIIFPEAARGAPAGVPLHPTQVYEILLMLALLALFASLRSERWEGTKLLWYLFVYGLGRTALDFLRGETSPTILGPLTLTQCVCTATALVALALLVFVGRRPQSDLADRAE